MALEGFTIGGSKTTAPAAPASSPVKKSGALSGFNIGATPSVVAPISGDSALRGFTSPIISAVGHPKVSDTEGVFSKFLSVNKLDPLPQPSYSGISGGTAATIPGQFENHDNTPLGIATNTVKGIPEAAASVSKAINNTVIKAPADLLDDSKFIQEAAAGTDTGDVSGNFGQNVLQKLAIGVATIKGMTGGLYEPPPELANANPDLLDKGLNAITEGLGMAIGMGSIGSAIGATARAGKVVQGLTTFVNRFPKVAKYITPYIAPFVENTAGFAAYSQLDPNLGGDLAKRSTRLLEAIGTAPLYVALGAIKNPALGLSASFLLGFGMAKLSGATNEDAAVSGTTFAFLDAAGRSTGHRGLAPKEIRSKMTEESLKVLNQYATDIKLTERSTPSQVEAVFNRAVHQSAPELGGNPQQFNAAKSAFDYLSQGGAAEKTKAETSAEILSNEVKDVVDTHGPDVAHIAITEKLGVSPRIADKLIKGASKPRTPADVNKISDKAVANLSPVKRPETKEEAADRYSRDVLSKSAAQGKATVIGADNLKDHFGKDYDIKNHPIYSGAANELLNRALKENKDPTVKFTVGGPGAGKSDFIVGNEAHGFKGTIYDSTGWKYEGGLKDQIARAEAAGKKVELYGIIPNIERSKAYTHIREMNGEHPVTDTAFARGHSGAIDTMIKAIEDGHTVYVLDTRGINSKADAAKAEYKKNPLELLKQVRYSEEDVKQRVSHITRDNAVETAKQSGESGPRGVSQENGAGEVKFPNGTKVYRGNRPGDQFEPNKVTDAGVSVSLGREPASRFARIHGGEVTEHFISPSANILKFEDIPSEFIRNDRTLGATPSSAAGTNLENLIKWAKDNGYDAVDVRKFGEGEIRIINPDVLRNTNSPVQGTGESKVRGLSQSVEDAVLSKKLTDTLGELPQYDTVNMADQAKLANELISRNYEQAKRIAMGIEPAPEGLLSSVMFKAVELKAIKDRDISTLSDLATQSELLSSATEAGQFISGFANRDPESPVKAIADVKKAREVAAERKMGDVSKAKKKIVNEIKAEIRNKAPKKQSWSEFVDSITC